MSTSFTKHQIELLVNTRHKHASLFETRNSIDLCKAWDIVCSELKFEQTKANIRRKYSGLLDSYKKSKRNNRLFEYAYLFENKVEMDERGKVQLMDESSDDGNLKMKRKGKLGVDVKDEKLNDSKDIIEQNKGTDNGISKSIEVLDSDENKKKTKTGEFTNDNEIKKKKELILYKKPRINKKPKYMFNSQRPAKQKNEEYTETSADHEKGYYSTIDNNEDMLPHYNNALSSEHNNLSQNKNEESNAEEYDSTKNVDSDVGDSIETVNLTSKKSKTNVNVNEKKKASKNENNDKNAVTNETKQTEKLNRIKKDNKRDKLYSSKKTKNSKLEYQDKHDKKYKFSDLSPEDNHKILKLYEDMLRQSRKNKIVNKQNENKINELDVNNINELDDKNTLFNSDQKTMLATKDSGFNCHDTINNSDSKLSSKLLHNNDTDLKLKTQKQDTSEELKMSNTAQNNEKNNTFNKVISINSNNIEQNGEKKRNIQSQQKDKSASCSTNKQENTSKLNNSPSNNCKVTYFEDEKADELAKSINKLNGNIALLIDVLKNHMQKQ